MQSPVDHMISGRSSLATIIICATKIERWNKQQLGEFNQLLGTKFTSTKVAIKGLLRFRKSISLQAMTKITIAITTIEEQNVIEKEKDKEKKTRISKCEK